MAYNPSSVFEAIRVYVEEVGTIPWLCMYHKHPHPNYVQAPTYHVVIEVVLGLWIIYLLFFSKQYRPKSKHDKLSKDVCEFN